MPDSFKCVSHDVPFIASVTMTTERSTNMCITTNQPETKFNPDPIFKLLYYKTARNSSLYKHSTKYSHIQRNSYETTLLHSF